MQLPSPGKVLFISHEASRSGAPIVLLHLIKWIKNNTSLEFEILLLTDGPLKADFEQLGKTFLLDGLTGRYTYPGRIKRKVLRFTGNHEDRKAAAHLSKRSYGLVYGNTIVSLPWLKIFKEDHALKTICCIHELSYVLNYLFSKAYLEENLQSVDLIIAVSKAVKDTLIRDYQTPPANIQLEYEFIPGAVQLNPVRLKTLELGADADDFIIGMGGTPEWRKGTDLIIPLANKLRELYPDFKFKIVWLGAGLENGFVKQLLYDARKCGIAGKLIFIESSPNPMDYISHFDVFVLLSREDPFPLIALEAALLGKPIIAFENSGGISELIEQGAGLLAPYLDIATMANQVYQLSKDELRLKALGRNAHELVSSKYTTSVISPAIYALITGLLDPKINSVNSLSKEKS